MEPTRKWHPLTQSWYELGITRKFALAFGVLLAINLVIGFTGLFSLTLLRQHTQTAILGSIDDELTTEDTDSLVFAPEVEQARQQIDQTSRIAILVLLVTMTAAVILTVIIGLLFNRAITRNVVKLTEAAVELQSGNLDARAEIESADELGQLATTLNLLATQITTLVDDLEERAIEAQTRLVAAIENIPEGLSLFDENDRLLLFNSKYKELHDEHSDIIKVGAKFEHIMRSTAEKGRYVDADGRLDEWIGQRLARHQKPSGAFEQPLSDGRWIQISEYKTEDDEIFGLYTEITERKQTEEMLQKLYSTVQTEKQRSDNLLNVVIPIGVALSAEQNFDRLLEKILLEAKTFCNADAGTLYLRTASDTLDFVLVRNDTLKIAMGGSSGQPINFSAISLYDEHGQANHHNVAAHVALTGTTISIVDAYQAEGFNFSGTTAFDAQTGYRSTSFLTIPLKNAHDYVLGVLQLINALDSEGQIVPFDPVLEQLVASLSALATVALEAYIREQNLRKQIRQLEIEIDEVKRQQQVTEIVETDFFQDLQSKARQMRRRQSNSDDL